MDSLYIIKRLALFLSFFLVSASAFSANTWYSYQRVAGSHYGTAAEPCQLYDAYVQALWAGANPVTVTNATYVCAPGTTDLSPIMTNYTYTQGGVVKTTSYKAGDVHVVADCVSPQVWNVATGTCAAPSCPSPLVFNATTNACEDKCKLNYSGRVPGVTGHNKTGVAGAKCTNVPDSTCVDLCTFNVVNSACSLLDNKYSLEIGYGTGVSCTGLGGVAPDAVAGEPPTVESCLGQKKGFASVGGVGVCVSQGSKDAPPIVTKEAPKTQDATTKDATGATTSSTGSTGTKTTTVNGDGTVTTSTTTTNLDGSTGSANKTEGKDSFCTENPQSPICKNSIFVGNCTAFVCDGDAIQCAMAKEQHSRNCAFFDTPTPLSELGQSVLDGVDPKQAEIDAAMGSDPVDINGEFNAKSSAGWLGGAGDLPPVSFSAMGSTFTLDTSLLSDFMRAIGYVFVAVAGVIAVRIVGTSSSV